VWAGVLFVVVLAIASWRSLSATGPNGGNGDVVRLDNSVSLPSNGGLRGADIVGKPAPPTSFTAFDGNNASLGDHAGRPIVLNFWSSSCAPCITEMPAFEQVHQQFGDKVVFVGLDTVDGETPARAMAARIGVTYQLGFDPDGAIAKSFGVINLPTTVLIDRNGQVVDRHFGELSGDELTKAINAKLAP